VRRHIVGAFVNVPKYGIPVRHQPCHETFQIRLNLRVGILAQDQ
jgi:hypothetical protein